MIRKVCIVEDDEDQYLALKNMLQSEERKKLVSVIDHYFTNRPFDVALNFIRNLPPKNKPEILFIDYELKNNQRGDDLFKELNTYPCFAVFMSRLHGEADIATQFGNATFITKHVDPIVKPLSLDRVLLRAIEHLERDKDISFQLYGEAENESFNEFSEHTIFIKISNIIRLLGVPKKDTKGKKVCKMEYVDKGEVKVRFMKTKTGPGEIGDMLLEASSLFVVHKKKPYLLFNRFMFKLNKIRNQYELTEGIIATNKISFPS